MLYNRRRSQRLKGYDYSQPGAYFVTICTHNQQCIFGEITDGNVQLNEIGKTVRDQWLESSEAYAKIILDEFIVMPNHIHGVVILKKSSNFVSRIPRKKITLSKFIGRFKMQSSKKVNQICKSPGTSIWQRNYYEHIIRNEDDLTRTREYIINNPLKWELDKYNPS